MYFKLNFNKNLVLMYAISLLQGMVFYGSVSTLYRQAVGVTLFQITLMESLSMVLTIVLEIPWGILLAAVISGLSGVDTSILYLSAKGKDTQRIFGFFNTMSVAGLFLASGMYSLFIGKDYRMAGLLTAVSYGIAAFLSLWLTEVREETKETERKNSWQIFCQTLPELFGRRNVTAFLVSMAISAFAVMLIQVSFSLLQPLQTEMQNRMIAPGHRAAMLSVYAVFMDSTAAVVDLLFGKAADFHLPLAMLLGTLACTLGLFLYCRGSRKKNTI